MKQILVKFYKGCWITFFLLWSCNTFCQHKITITVNDLSLHIAETVYITGAFNNWNPGNADYKLKKIDSNIWKIILEDIPKGTLNYKFTQGKWETEEATTAGETIDNHTLDIEKDYSIVLNIYGWKNNAPQFKKHTASKNVHLLADSFYIPKLQRFRKVVLYLPANYYTSKVRYPVLYMHDGQNLFDEFTAPFGEWGIDEALDSLQKQTGKYAIVVGIDHGNEKRITEYNFENNIQYGAAEGQQYVDFVATTLKNYIDKKYRTKKDKLHTAIAGSSLGGLISAYAVIKYPETFGTAGIFSPAFWIAPTIDLLTRPTSEKIENRFWFYAGDKESSDMVPDIKIIKNNLEKNIKNEILFTTDKTGAHNEKTWRKWFPSFYKWWVKRI